MCGTAVGDKTVKVWRLSDGALEITLGGENGHTGVRAPSPDFTGTLASVMHSANDHHRIARVSPTWRGRTTRRCSRHVLMTAPRKCGIAPRYNDHTI